MDSKEELKTSDYLKGIVLNLPDSPGIYQYLNTEGTIIYVGKAKNLKRRVYSYFAKEHQSAKTRILVSKIADIKYIVVNSEEDALLLENNSKNTNHDTTSCLKTIRATLLSASVTSISHVFSRHGRLSEKKVHTSVLTATFLQ